MSDPFEFQENGILPFKESLDPKSTTTSVLCERLQRLHADLSKMEQQKVDTSSLETVKKDLYPLINHKDKYIKILVSCCLSDILRLYAPEVIYSSSQLKVLFA